MTIFFFLISELHIWWWIISFKKFKLSGYMYNPVMLPVLWTLVNILHLKGFQSHVQIYVLIVKYLCINNVT